MVKEIKTWDDVIELVKEEMVICPEFRKWEEEWNHIKPCTTETERFISWFKREKLNKLKQRKE